jgi:uncharacterized protein (DUF2236 family)
MQLALPPVGYGVLESTVESGQVTRHPLKRFRTTFTYLAVAMLGTDEDRDRFRAAVDTVHRHVRSTATSPVRYNALDPNLQLWVAACLYYGSVDLYSRMYGPMDGATADAFYQHAARFATTLQVPARMWPPDRAYLVALMRGKHLPAALRRASRFSTWVTTGFLPPPFRAQMRLTWSAADEQRFTRFLRRLGTVHRALPLPLRRFPFNALLWDMRLRHALGRPLV